MIGGGRDQLVVWLLFVGRHLLEFATEAIEGEGERLTAVDAAALLALRAFPSMSQTELAALLMRDKTTLSRTLARLEESGFIVARMDPVDGRRKTLDLTEKSRALVTPALESITERLENAVSGMSAEEERACFSLLERLIENVSVV
ncbi:MAG TPA: MarR family transcriptional regulator [Rhodothermales bacterium]|nr:MarR family transcriptional regulator [Rhodothermales bacterium]